MLALLVATALVHTDLSEVRACLPQSDGAILVGTGGGLVRVDATGAVTQTWTAMDGLPGTRIDGLALIEGELWVGTDAGAAAVTLEPTLTVTRTAATTSVHGGAWFEGARYLATDEGVLKVGTAKPLPYAEKAANAAKRNRARTSSLAVVDGVLYAGTAHGLHKLTKGKLALVTIESGANEVTGLLADGNTLYVATTAGLFARTADVVQAYGGGELRALARIDGVITVVGVGGTQQLDRGRLVAAGPKATVLATIAEQGGVACTGGIDGLWLRAAQTWTAVARPPGPPANDLSALAVDGTKLYVGTFDHGLAVLEAGTWRAITSPRLDRRINAIHVASDHRVFVGTAAGLSIVGTDGVVSTLGKRDGLPARGVLSLAPLADGRMLVGTLHGAAIVGTGRPIHLAAKTNLDLGNVWAVAQDATGALWLGTTTGLYRGTVDDQNWTRYAVATGHLRDDWVMAIVTRGDTLWAGTYKGGVTRLDTLAAPTATHLGDGWINPGGLAFDGDSLVAATMEGLRTSALDGATWKPAGTLPSKDVTATARIGAVQFVATRRGLVARSFTATTP